jgi:hypothetical protein
VLGFSLVFAVQANVFAADTPHNAGSSVDCGECHGNALFPVDTGGMTADELRDAYNNMCKRCHISNAGVYHGTSSPIVGAHDSERRPRFRNRLWFPFYL